jgi:hypothetical protein
MLGLAAITLAAIFAGAGSAMRIGFPAMAFAVGLLLYLRYPLIYISYTCWIWFLTPFVRRLVDWKAGYQEPSTVLLAPYLVTLIMGWVFVRSIPKARQSGNLPFVLSSIGIAYGFLVGIVNVSVKETIVPLLTWSTPLLFGFYLVAQWREYPTYSRILRRTFLWMVLLTGAYGIYQYVVAPEWDTSWLTLSGLTASGGKAEPYGMRVFSTMNSSGPFSVVMTGGLLLLFSEQSSLKLPASGVGYLSLLLTQGRAAWVGWLVGLFVLGSALKPKLQMRLFLTVIMMALCVFPLATIEPFGEVISGRLDTFNNLEGDTSYVGRTGIYQSFFAQGIYTVIGLGLGGLKAIGTTMDSAVVDTVLTFGWLGTSYYVCGLLLLLITLFKVKEARSDTFASATRAISMAMAVMLLFSNGLINLSGLMLWGFLGIGTAANKYYSARPSNLPDNRFSGDQ